MIKNYFQTRIQDLFTKIIIKNWLAQNFLIQYTYRKITSDFSLSFYVPSSSSITKNAEVSASQETVNKKTMVIL